MEAVKKVFFQFLSLLLSLATVFCFAMPSSTVYAEGGSAMADVVFVIDSTGSMSDEISSVRSGVTDFVSQLVSAGVDLRIGILEYRDITCDGEDSTIIHTLKGSPWHYTVDQIEDTLDGIDADGGGDTPETLVDALGFITEGKMKFRSGARKFAVVLTDASYKTENRHGYKNMDVVLEKLQEMAVSTSIITYEEYYDYSFDEGDDSPYVFDATVAGKMLSKRSAMIGARSVLETSINPGYEPPVDEAEIAKKKEAVSKDALEEETIAKEAAFGDIADEELSTETPALGSSASDDLYELSSLQMGAAKAISNGNTTAIISTSGYDLFSFKPSKTAVYTFKAASGSDTYGYLFGPDGTQLYTNDDYNGSDFSITARMSGGVEYYYAVRYYNESQQGSFTVNLSTSDVIDSSCSYRELAEGTNGILADISGDFSGILFDMAQQIMNLSYQAKKAIYILPGYMGSKLFTKSGEEAWVNTDYLMDDVKKYLVPGGENTIFAMDNNGGSSQVEVNLSKDKYGTQDTYKTMVEQFKEQCGDNYDVVFFAYNWLGDLTDSAKRLEKHIQANGYDKVVLVTHSTGGLLAANFISRNRDNKKRVEKAILIAAPLYGTYTSLQPIETGKTKDLDSMLENNGISAGFLGIKHSVVHNWVKAVTKNSPTTYQLLPSEEYLKTAAVVYEDDIPNPVTTRSKYYEVLNGSSNINSNLTNGNERSHDYFRTTILGGDIIKVLKSVDTYLIGSKNGNATPAIAVYSNKLLGGTKLEDIIYKNDGDGTVMGISSSAQRTSGKIELNYKDFSPCNHGDLASEKNVLDYICGKINEGSSGKAAEPKVKLARDTANAGGMSSYVKFNINCNYEVLPYVTDPDGNEIDVTSADARDAIYTVLNEEEGDYGSLLYLPVKGWKFSLRPADEGAEDLSGTVVVSVLDDEGYKIASSEYIFSNADEGQDLITFDLSGLVASTDNLNILASGQTGSDVKEINTDWELQESLTFESIGITAQAELTGEAVSSGKLSAGDLNWTSADESIASVDTNGNIISQGYGKTVITALQKGSNKALTCEIIVKKLPTSLSVEDAVLEVGERLPISPVFDSDDVTEIKVAYEPEEEGIIEIEEDVIIALQEGSVKVTATAEGGATTTFTVTVTVPNNTSAQSIEISEDQISLDVGDSKTLTASVLPEDSADKGVVWTTRNRDIVELTDYGDGRCKIEALRPGTAEVYAVSNDGGYSATVQVKCIGNIKDAKVVLNQTTFTYTGSEITQEIVITDGDKTLVEDTDYTVEYEGNIYPGTATVTITGIGVYTGTIPLTFTIKQLATPTLSSVSASADAVIVKWGAVSGANKYRVFRKVGTGGWKQLAITTSTSYTDKTVEAGKKYTYTVRCVADDEKTYVSGYNTTGKAITCAATPTLSAVQNQATGVKFTWKKATGAVKYRVFKKTGTGGWKKLVDTTSLSYLDKSVKSGTKYAYTVRCITSDGKVYTSGYNTTGKVIAFVTRPTISKISSTKAKSVGVWWSKVSGVTGYIIQCSPSSTFASGNKNTYVKSATAVAKTVTGLTSKKKYYVRMRTYKTVSGKNYYSAWSAAKSVTVK